MSDKTVILEEYRFTRDEYLQYVEEMVSLIRDYGDQDTDHMLADKLLCKVLKRIGMFELVEAFEKVEKWYA